MKPNQRADAALSEIGVGVQGTLRSSVMHACYQV